MGHIIMPFSELVNEYNCIFVIVSVHQQKQLNTGNMWLFLTYWHMKLSEGPFWMFSLNWESHFFGDDGDVHKIMECDVIYDKKMVLFRETYLMCVNKWDKFNTNDTWFLFKAHNYFKHNILK